MTSQRRFPPPWTVEETPGGFAIYDANGLRLAWVYCRDKGAWGASTHAVIQLSPDEARRIANGIARLPELLAKSKSLQAD